MTRPLDDERRDSGATPVAPEPEPAEEQPQPEPAPEPAPEQPEEPEHAGADEPTDAAEHEHQLERDLDELTAKAEKADEYLELAQRTKADFENYRKRTAREAAAAQERGVIKLVRELLPAVDNLDRAVAALNGSGESEEVASGVKLVHHELIAALGRAGVELF